MENRKMSGQRILLLVDCYFPVPKSAPQLIHDLAREFLRLGYQPVILHPTDTILSNVEISMECGLEIVRVRYGRLKGIARLLRGVREALLPACIWWRAGRFLRKNPAHLIIYYSPSIFWGPLVSRLKRLWNCPSYLILRDIWPQFLVDTGVLRQGVLLSYLRSRAASQNRVADWIGVQTTGDLHFVNEHLQVEVLHNWISLEQPQSENRGYRKSLALDGKVVFFYGGNFGIAQDLHNILRLAHAMLKDSQVRFLLVGTGSEEARLRQFTIDHQLENVIFHPPIGQQEYLDMMSEFDVGLISLNQSFRIQNIPGKLMGYLLQSKPVLASVNPGNDIRKLLEESGAGLCSWNGDDEELLKNAQLLVQNRDLRRQMGCAGRQLLELRFSSVSAAHQILDHFK